MKTGLKVIGVWIALVAGQIIAGIATLAVIPIHLPAASDGPLDTNQALLVVNAAYAVVMGLLAMRLDGSLWKRAAILFAALYGVEGIQAGIETIYFNQYLKLPANTILFIFVSNAIKTAIAALAAASLWRRNGHPAPTPLTGLAWKIPLIALIYVPVYFIAGEFIAWQGAELRTYYLDAVHINKLEVGCLQLARGFIWAGLAWLLVRSLSGSRMAKVLLTGAVFSVFLSISLLYPVDFMAWDVRKMHMLEVGSSNLIFGVLAGLILLIPGRKVAASSLSHS